MADNPNPIFGYCPKCNESSDSTLAYFASAAGFLTLFFAISATTLYHIEKVRTADAEYLGLRTALTWYKKESDWINELVRTHRRERERSAQQSRTPSPSARNTTSSSPNPNQHTPADSFDDRPVIHNTRSEGHTTRHRNRTISGQSHTSRPTLSVETSRAPLHPDVVECVEAALKASAAVEDIDAEHDGATHLGPHHPSHHSLQTLHHRIPHLRRQQSSTSGSHSKWSQALPRVLELAARRRTAINAVINEFRRLKQSRRETELYGPLLNELRELDDQLRDVIRAIEPDLPFSRRTSAMAPSTLDQPSVTNGDANGNLEVGRPTQDLEFGQVALDIAATRRQKWYTLLRLSSTDQWTWSTRSQIAFKWLKVRDRALELKARRAALGNRVLFAVLIMISARLADQETRDERQCELIRELVEMRREWEGAAGEGVGGVTPT